MSTPVVKPVAWVALLEVERGREPSEWEIRNSGGPHDMALYDEASVAGLVSEVNRLKQAIWDARAIMGFDNDGDPTPAALTHPPIADLCIRDATEFRKDYDEACADVDAQWADATRWRFVRNQLLWAKGYGDTVKWAMDLKMSEPDISEKELGPDTVAKHLDAAIDAAILSAKP